MFEKVNPNHPDKIADRIAGAVVDLAYKKERDPKVACEVLIGHGRCFIINETDTKLRVLDVVAAVKRISGITEVFYSEIPQDQHLSDNQKGSLKCGDNGIFKGVPINEEEGRLITFARRMYEEYPFDGKFVYDKDTSTLIVCQSNVETHLIDADDSDKIKDFATICEINNSPCSCNAAFRIINPIGDWTGGTDVDSGATNRKLGSDMGRAVTGGGLHGKDLSKADVSLNIYAFLKAQRTNEEVNLYCRIGQEYVDDLPYPAIVEIARDYIFNEVGGFERFAEWGLIR